MKSIAVFCGLTVQTLGTYGLYLPNLSFPV